MYVLATRGRQVQRSTGSESKGSEVLVQGPITELKEKSEDSPRSQSRVRLCVPKTELKSVQESDNKNGYKVGQKTDEVISKLWRS